jgi:hypothetical protein
MLDGNRWFRRFCRLTHIISSPTTRLETKKADVAERPEAFDHVGLLFNGSPCNAELPFR